jgi:pseudouridine kinase
MLKVNRMEAQALLGQAVASVPDALAAAQALQARGPAQVIVSLGDQGVAWCDALGRPGFHPAPVVVVVNTSGAGDALLAGLVHGHRQGWNLESAVQFGISCAAMTLSSALANHPALSVRAVLDF